MTRLDDVAARALAALGPATVSAIAEHLATGWPDAAILQAVPPAEQPDASALLAAARAAGASGTAYLRGAASGYRQRADELTVEVVWSGPASPWVPVRATAAVLIDLVNEAGHELLLMTYSARPYQPLIDALRAAAGRHVTITAVVETLHGAGSALSGDEPAAAFTDVPAAEIWYWPTTRRPEPGSKMHAKLAIADQRTLLMTSANLTQAGVAKNIEGGLLVRGGTAPTRAREHIRELQANGTLTRLR
jgi:phosphatidylserine/phosphatidylglycerophosphate/cardiolipin synthase-like enzyme